MNIDISKNLIVALGFTYNSIPAQEELFILNFTLGGYTLDFYTLTNRVVFTKTSTSTIVIDQSLVEDLVISRIIKYIIDLDIYMPSPTLL